MPERAHGGLGGEHDASSVAPGLLLNMRLLSSAARAHDDAAAAEPAALPRR